MKILPIIALAVLTVAAAAADDKVTVTPADVDAAVKAMFKSAPAAWQARTDQDETQRICSETRNNPAPADVEKIQARERATVVFPADGTVLGDWKKGEIVAQTGTGGQFSDDAAADKGGNCYACHQMAPSEASYGTLGPNLAGYGKARNFAQADAKAAYAKIFNAQSVQPCSIMPRFGYHQFLTIDQIRDVTAYLMSPDSPVNK